MRCGACFLVVLLCVAATRGAPFQGAPVSAASGTCRSPHQPHAVSLREPAHPGRVRYGGRPDRPTVVSAAARHVQSRRPEAATTGTVDRWLRVLSLRDHNTRVVLLGATLLGLAAGVVGSFTLLRKRALVGDALSHATFPGIGGAFLLGTALGHSEKSLPLLLAGAAASGVLGVGVLLVLRRYTRLKEDAALGVVLSVFFGGGLAVLGLVQQSGAGSAAGLGSFIYGKTASMVPDDVRLIGWCGLAAVVVCGLLFKEFELLCFDQQYAATQGWPVPVLDAALMALVVLVTVTGLQAVGLILVIALLITPAAAARFWTDRLLPMTVLAGLLGAGSALTGAAASAVFSKLPSGAVIVLAAAAVFAASMALGTARGVVPRAVRAWRSRRTIGRQHLLRALYELAEADDAAPLGRGVSFDTLSAERSWSPARLRRLAASARRAGLIEQNGGRWTLTDAGLADAARLVRNHRLWELYLIHHADVAPGQVDRDADRVEHVLGPEMVAELEALLAAEGGMPPNPHAPP